MTLLKHHHPCLGENMTQPRPKRSFQTGAMVIGSELVGFAVVGVLIDYALGTLHTIPWATLILAPLGLVIAMVHLVKLVKPRE
jgi:F0F1-type ATP synthase assembly protein I